LRHLDQNPVPLRILIVDDDAFFRRGLREILNEADGVRVVGEAADSDQAIEVAHDLCRRASLDLVLMDVDGLAAISRLVEEHSSLAVVVLTLSTSEADVVGAVKAGAVGYLSKHLGPDLLLRSLTAFHRGESLAMSREVGLTVLELARQGAELRQRRDTGQPTLTAREAEVLDLVASGARDRDIAMRLVISESTVKKHLQNILRKFHARNRVEAVARWQARS